MPICILSYKLFLLCMPWSWEIKIILNCILPNKCFSLYLHLPHKPFPPCKQMLRYDPSRLDSSPQTLPSVYRKCQGMILPHKSFCNGNENAKLWSFPTSPQSVKGKCKPIILPHEPFPLCRWNVKLRAFPQAMIHPSQNPSLCVGEN